MQQMTFDLRSLSVKQKVYYVIEQGGRYLVVRKLPNTEPLVIENCRTKQFAELCCDNYNSRISQ